MNERRLRIYLDDHLALMVAEVELIGRSWWNNRSTPLGEFLKQLENQVKAQQVVARDVIHRMGGQEGIESRAKQGAAWFAEKLGRFKLNDSLLRYSALSRVVELEALAVFAQERRALWDTLEAVGSRDQRLSGITFSFFQEQALEQHEELVRRRRFAAVEAFAEVDLEVQED